MKYMYGTYFVGKFITWELNISYYHIIFECENTLNVLDVSKQKENITWCAHMCKAVCRIYSAWIAKFPEWMGGGGERMGGLSEYW